MSYKQKDENEKKLLSEIMKLFGWEDDELDKQKDKFYNQKDDKKEYMPEKVPSIKPIKILDDEAEDRLEKVLKLLGIEE